MRLLMLHVDAFTCTITQKGRSPITEMPSTPSMHIDDGLLVLANAEDGDEADSDGVAERVAQEIRRLASQLKLREVMLLPFAHLFADPAPPEAALSILEAAAADLRSGGLRVERPPFGWFHTWDLQAKGHPLSRVARTVRPAGATAPQPRPENRSSRTHVSGQPRGSS
ncbi:MAG: hypothetical protein GEU73_02625 [Chloroflexi bacterium]|nr:hypothetical protein [Chloroflexota bacterium]